MRQFVRSHPDYKKDSVVSETVAYDLMEQCALIGEGKLSPPELFGRK